MTSRLERAHANTRRRINREADRLIRRAWIATGSEREFVREAVAISRSARQAVVGEVDAFLAAFLTSNGLPRQPLGLDADSYTRPVDPAEQWRRPYVHMRTKLKGGMEFAPASRFATQIATTMMATDLQVANRGASSDWLKQEPTVTGYRRTLSAGVRNCGLCIAASDQLYHREDLLPIHDNCACTVVPVSTTRRYGLSEGKYEQVIEQTGGDTSREALSNVRLGETQIGATEFRVVQHGEVGPYMFDAAHSPPLLSAAA